MANVAFKAGHGVKIEACLFNFDWLSSLKAWYYIAIGQLEETVAS